MMDGARSLRGRARVAGRAGLVALACWGGLVATSAARAAPAPPPLAAGEGRSFVVLLRGRAGDPSPEVLAAALGRRYHGTVDRVWRHALLGFRVRLAPRDARALAEDPRVTGVYPDPHFSTPIFDCFDGTVPATSVAPPSSPQSLTCDDPDPQNAAAVCMDNWGLDRIDQGDLPRDGRYHFEATGQGVHIYMIETGLYVDHDEFRGRVGASHDVITNGPVTSDCPWSHGTHTAGIAAGATYGVAKGAIIHPVKVWSCTGGLQGSDVVGAIDWIYQVHDPAVNGPAVANMSINAPPDVPMTTAMHNLIVDRGILLVESAGNQLANVCDWVQPVPEALIAGGADELDTPWERTPGDPNYSAYCPPDCGSNLGACVTLFAPAAHIVSSWGGPTPTHDGICRLSGTSMAAPHVTGAAALYLETHPSATPAEVKWALVQAASQGKLTALDSTSPNLLLHVGPPEDASVPADAGLVAPDAEPRDAVPSDTGAEDSGAADAPGLDAAEADAGVVDAASGDVGARDGGGEDVRADDAGADDLGGRGAGAILRGALGGGCRCVGGAAAGPGALPLLALVAVAVTRRRRRG